MFCIVLFLWFVLIEGVVQLTRPCRRFRAVLMSHNPVSLHCSNINAGRDISGRGLAAVELLLMKLRYMLRTRRVLGHPSGGFGAQQSLETCSD